jgi:hypothetical protein
MGEVSGDHARHERGYRREVWHAGVLVAHQFPLGGKLAIRLRRHPENDRTVRADADPVRAVVHAVAEFNGRDDVHL